MFLLDSNIIIYAALPEHAFLRKLIREEESQVSAGRQSAVTKVEVLGYHNLDQNSKKLFEEFFDSTQVIPITSAVIELAVTLRQQKKMSLGDALIAATALEHELTLLSRNKADFQHILNLNVVDPFEEQDA